MKLSTSAPLQVLKHKDKLFHSAFFQDRLDPYYVEIQHQSLASSSLSSSSAIQATVTDDVSATLSTNGNNQSLLDSPSSRIFATTSADGTAKVWVSQLIMIVFEWNTSSFPIMLNSSPHISSHEYIQRYSNAQRMKERKRLQK